MEQAIKSIFFEQVVKAVISKIIIAVPFLGWPVINQIFTAIITKFATMFYDELHTFGVFMKIDFKVNNQREEYEDATDALRVSLGSTTQTEEEKQKARDEYKEKLRMLISLNNS